MRRSQVYAIALALVAAVALVWLVWGGKGEGAVAPGPLFLAAKAELKAGKFLDPASLEWRAPAKDARGQLPEAARLVADSKANREMLVTVVPRRDLAPGAFISEADLVKPQDPDFLPSVLRPGYRAIAIRVDDVTGGAGLFRPGNFVDVLFARTPGRRNTNARETHAARALLRGVRILAVNRDLGVESGAEAKPGKEESGRNAKGTVTLEVQPKGAELLTVARGMGELSLALRSQGENESALGGGVTDAAEVMTGSGRRTGGQVRELLGTTQKTTAVD